MFHEDKNHTNKFKRKHDTTENWLFVVLLKPAHSDK